ncbi:4754_t:CDS:2, partial [Scutellospora calospora]
MSLCDQQISNGNIGIAKPDSYGNAEFHLTSSLLTARATELLSKQI